jgi:hypothetical protein
MFMASHDPDEFEDDDTSVPGEWDDFRDEDFDPIGIEKFKQLKLSEMPEDVFLHVMDDYFPETTVSRDGDFLVCEIEEHLYTKYWEHKFSAYAFAEAMERAVRRLAHEGHPLSDPSHDDEDIHIFVSWNLRLPRDIEPDMVVESIKSAFDLVWQRGCDPGKFGFRADSREGHRTGFGSTQANRIEIAGDWLLYLHH